MLCYHGLYKRGDREFRPSGHGDYICTSSLCLSCPVWVETLMGRSAVNGVLQIYKEDS